MRDFDFDYATIRAAYDAGEQAGIDRATAFEWGSISRVKDTEDIAEVLHEAVNDGRCYGEEGYVGYDEVHGWVTRKEEELQECRHQPHKAHPAPSPQDAADAQ